jgi:hypothetical protein
MTAIDRFPLTTAALEALDYLEARLLNADIINEDLLLSGGTVMRAVKLAYAEDCGFKGVAYLKRVSPLSIFDIRRIVLKQHMWVA